MIITFLSAKKALAKEITKDGSKPYPLVKDFTSHEEEITIDKKGSIELFRALCSQVVGHVHVKSPFEAPTRYPAGMSNRQHPRNS